MPGLTLTTRSSRLRSRKRSRPSGRAPRAVAARVSPHPSSSSVSPALRGRYARGDDLCELDRVDELAEARYLAVADIPDVDCGLVQGLAACLAGAGVADDCRDGCAGFD